MPHTPSCSETTHSHSTTQLPRYIAIEGCIGVGKTTLSTELAKRFNGNCVLEQVEENPFLNDFYQDRSAHAFKTEIFFLLSRYKQQQALQQQELFSPMLVSDYIIQKNKIFADLTLEGSELSLYTQLYSTLSQHIISPDLLIYLRAPIEVICARIAKRGRSFEKNIDVDYLERLIDSYDTFFAHYDKSPLLILETEELNFPERTEDINYVIELLFDAAKNKRSSHVLNKNNVRQLSLFKSA